MNLYEGRDIRVVARLFDDNNDGLVITFTGRAANPPVEKGFGESYLFKRRVSAVHFISKENHWWQTPETNAAIAELRSRGLIGGDRRLTLYGSSMGGYAALILSRQIKPKRIVLFSPQYSIDAKRVPFERRWRSYAAKLKFDYDDMAAGIDLNAEIKVVYDPFFEPDRRHVELVEQIRPVDHIPVSFAGHNTARTLEELGIITRVIDNLLFGDFDVKAFTRLYRDLRPASSLMWFGLSQTLSRHNHRGGALLASSIAARIILSSGKMKDLVVRRDVLRTALSAACDADMPRFAKQWLLELERIESSNVALAYSRALVARAEGDWTALDSHVSRTAGQKGNEAMNMALKIEAIGRLSGASAALAYRKSLPGAVRRSAPVLLVQARFLAEIKNWTMALEVLNKYLRHNRLNPAARMLLAHCWMELGRPDAAIKQVSPILHYHLVSDKLSEEIAALVGKVRGDRHAEKIRARHKRYKRLFATAMTALGNVNWIDANEPIAALRSLARMAAAQRPS